MKNGKKLTRAQKIRLREVNLRPDNWLALTNEPDGFMVIHRESHKVRKVPKRNV